MVKPKKRARISHTQWMPEQLELQGLGTYRLEVDFSAGQITSDAGSLLLREVEKGTGVLRSFADCFVDGRTKELVEHRVLGPVSKTDLRQSGDLLQLTNCFGIVRSLTLGHT